MPLTYTGRLVRPGGLEHPSLIDIAVGTSRQPRFAAQGSRWFSVLDHMLFCDQLARRAGESNFVRIALLLHDAHECITADVPTDVKTESFRDQQKVLDVVIHDAFFPRGRSNYVSQLYDSDVRRYDRRALCAEAQVVGPPAEMSRILEVFGICDETESDVVYLQGMLGLPPWYPNGGLPWVGLAPWALDQNEHPSVQEYIKRMTELL